MNRLKSVLVMVLMGIVNGASPEIRAMIESFIRQLWEKVKKTPTIIDDALVKLLAAVLDVDLPE